MDIEHHGVDLRDIGEVIHDVDGDHVRAAEVHEVVVDARAVLRQLAARCVAHGVEVAVGISAQRIVIDNGGMRGVETSQGLISAPNVVVCAGIGTGGLLDRSGSVIGRELGSRLEMMMAYPGELPRPVVGLEFGWPAIAQSALQGTVLASRYGGVQRWVNRPSRWPVPASEAAQLSSELGRRQTERPEMPSSGCCREEGVSSGAGIGRRPLCSGRWEAVWQRDLPTRFAWSMALPA
ncbi:FAD-dependent oxidoreductase [Nocardia sp. CA-135398]|uniref:FAD-dependent oxidoreductase n=1 Tax=Nocardia sp. CA-135398 TaxID=3239977 RepID=UPI003D988A2C